MSHRPLLIGLLAFAGATSATPLAAQDGPRIYGYFSSRVERSWDVPELNGTAIAREDSPKEFAQPFFSLMFQHQVAPKFNVFVNLNGSSTGALTVRNSWGEYALSEKLAIRIGRIYRKFGLYNEILDAVPSYYGIEPPETFDGDHLILTRTTSLMVYGSAPIRAARLNWSVATDNGEGSTVTGASPLQGDVHVVTSGGVLKFGVSGYRSNGGVTSDVGVAGGSPKSGVLPWAARDSFSVINGYAQVQTGRFIFQAEAARANHAMARNPAAVVSVVGAAGVNAAQRARFLLNPAGAVNAANVRVSGDHVVSTWYLRAGYSIDARFGQIAPYVQWDDYRNPETIASKRYGGDEEAGESDNGAFSKATIGVVFRPTPAVALKIDSSSHRYLLGGRRVAYPELRIDLSFTFGF